MLTRSIKLKLSERPLTHEWAHRLDLPKHLTGTLELTVEWGKAQLVIHLRCTLKGASFLLLNYVKMLFLFLGDDWAQTHHWCGLWSLSPTSQRLHLVFKPSFVLVCEGNVVLALGF